MSRPAGTRTAMRVVLVCMPFASVDRPALGVSALKARLLETGSECDVVYPSLAFAQLLGRHAYDRIAEHLPSRSLVGEWVFAGCLFREDGPPADAYVDDVLRRVWDVRQEDVDVVLAARASAATFIEASLRAVDWSNYDVVGFSSSTSQNVASLSLARMIKRRHPGATIVFGGANWQGEMGAESLRRFPFVDLAFSGEADVALPAALEALGRDDHAALASVPGILLRRAGRVAPPRRPRLADLDALPIPDHSEFYETLARSPAARGFSPSVPVETSRGCWWAERHPCGFCGLDQAERVYRTKSPGRVLRELRDLAARWRGGRLYIVDSVVSPAFLGEVLPALAADPLPLPLFFEVRADLTREQVRLIGEANASIQPGIESFSDHVLRLMIKGTRGLENIRLLKWCKTYGVVPYWNVLFGFPGETRADYDEMISLLPSVSFLCPPRMCERLSVDRYSPFHLEPDRHGFHDIEPPAPYSYVYPFPRRSLLRMAFSFSCRCDPPCIEADQEERLKAAVRSWRLGYTRHSLRRRERADGTLSIVDERPDATVREAELDDLERLLYDAADDIATREELRAAARGSAGADEAAVDERLRSLVDRRLMVSIGGRYLSLALPDPHAPAAGRPPRG